MSLPGEQSVHRAPNTLMDQRLGKLYKLGVWTSASCFLLGLWIPALHFVGIASLCCIPVFGACWTAVTAWHQRDQLLLHSIIAALCGVVLAAIVGLLLPGK